MNYPSLIEGRMLTGSRGQMHCGIRGHVTDRMCFGRKAAASRRKALKIRMPVPCWLPYLGFWYKQGVASYKIIITIAMHHHYEHANSTKCFQRAGS